ncbi:MAG: hypothetical protein QW532_05755 [Archaeoglobaceae archaeon]
MDRKSRVKGALGILFGLILYYFWAAFLLFLSYYFFAEESIVGDSKVLTLQISKHVFDWFICGVIPAFLILGHYAATVEQEDVKLIKLLLASFLIWLLILILIDLLGISISFEFNVAGGYFLMLAILLGIRISKKGSPTKDEGK